ncbi:MAG: hypothetical protein J5940_07920 [Clostridia bacterium]|nr:hypothetical protein [Clostridia bacterium]
MNAEKRKYIIGRFAVAAVALVVLAIIMYLLLRPAVPSGVYVNAELESSVEFGEGLAVTYRAGEKVYKGTAVKRGAEYRAAVSDGDEEFIITVSVYKGYIEISDGRGLDKAVFKR